MRNVSLLALLTVFVGFLALPVKALAELPDSLNVPKAQAAYDAAKRVADDARRDYDVELGRYNGFVSTLRSAQASEAAAERALSDAQSELAAIEQRMAKLTTSIQTLQKEITDDEYRRQRYYDELRYLQNEQDRLERERDRLDEDIRYLERRISQLEIGNSGAPWRCCFSDSGDEEHGPHCAVNADQPLASSKAEQACLAVHGKCRPHGCRREDSPELTSLRRQLQDKREDRNRVMSSITYKEGEIRNKERAIRDLDYEISTAQNKISQANSDYAMERDKRDRQLTVVSSAEDRLRQAESNTLAAKRDVDAAAPAMYAAKGRWESAQRDADTALAHLNTVKQAYASASNAILATAASEADAHAKREADERAPASGASEGTAEGKSIGSTQGLSEAKERDYRRGILNGYKIGSSASHLASSYTDGLAMGRARATEKGRLEDFPRGYNDDLRALLASTPSSDETIDMGASLPDEAGQVGTFLSATQKPLGQLAPPQFSYPEEPAYTIPSAGQINAHTPSATLKYSRPPCDNLTLPEMSVNCRDHYLAQYKSRFASHYESAFVAAYTPNFNAAVKESYDTALAATQTASFAAGENVGARDAGTLKGFEEALPQVVKSQYAEGQAFLASALSEGHLLVLRSAGFADENNDGVASPGEKIMLKLVIDNFGHRATAASALKVRVAKSTLLENLSGQERALPSLAGRTRTTLLAVITATTPAKLVGANFSLEGELLVANQSTVPQIITTFTASGTSREPLELKAIAVPTKLYVEQWVWSQITLQNNLPRASGPVEVSVKSTRAKVLEFGDMPLKVPSLDALASGNFKARVKGSLWVGPETDVGLEVSVKSADGQSKTYTVNQRFETLRNASLGLRDANNQLKPDAQFAVAAGGRLIFKTPFLFHATQAQWGPYQWGTSATSSTDLRACSGSTTSYSVQNVAPGTTFAPSAFCYEVPSTLAGKDGWVVITLQENGRAIHSLPVYFHVN